MRALSVIGLLACAGALGIAGGLMSSVMAADEHPRLATSGGRCVELPDLAAPDGGFVGCMSGPQFESLPTACDPADFDGDIDADLRDFAAFQLAFQADCPPARNLVVFIDPDSDFSTSDVHDVDDEIVQFDADTKEMIWAADGQAFNAGYWTTNGNYLTASQAFQVRFGTSGGISHAYFTETGPATICDIRVSSNQLSIYPTTELVPHD